MARDIVPKPTLDTSSSNGNPTTTQTLAPQTNVSVGSIVVQPGAEMPGYLEGTLNKVTLNVLVNTGNHTNEGEPVDVNNLVSDALKITSESRKTFFPHNNNDSLKTLIGTKEDVEGLSRRWCYLITALVVLSLITLMATAVLSLSSWRSNQVPDLDPATQTTVAALSDEEKHFGEIPNGPTIITRSMWLAAPPRGPLDRNTLPVKMVVVCHTNTATCSSEPECIDRMRSVQKYQQETRRWPEIGYNFAIGGDGSVYWARGFDTMAQHMGTSKFNNGSIVVAFIGNFVNTLPNDSQMKAFNKLMWVGVKEGKIAADYILVAQCQLKVSAAPGLALVNNMKTWPHFNSSLPIRCTAG